MPDNSLSQTIAQMNLHGPLLERTPVQGQLWAINQHCLPQFVGGGNAESQPMPRLPKVRGSIVIIPVHGVLTKRGFEGWYRSYPSTERIGRAIQAAAFDEAIGGIVLDVDSPGGEVYGCMELSDTIYNLRNQKPIVAVCNPVMASAAYWIGTSAQQVVCTPSGDVGSVGVWCMHQDWSQCLEEMGLKTTLISAGKYKVEGNSYEPLSDEAKEEFQRSVDESYGQFIDAVARNRGVAKSVVLENFGEGRMLSALRAKQAGMIDRVAMLNDVVAGMTSKAGATRDRSAYSQKLILSAWDNADIEPEASQQDMEASALKRKRRQRDS